MIRIVSLRRSLSSLGIAATLLGVVSGPVLARDMGTFEHGGNHDRSFIQRDAENGLAVDKRPRLRGVHFLPSDIQSDRGIEENQRRARVFKGWNKNEAAFDLLLNAIR